MKQWRGRGLKIAPTKTSGSQHGEGFSIALAQGSLAGDLLSRALLRSLSVLAIAFVIHSLDRLGNFTFRTAKSDDMEKR